MPRGFTLLEIVLAVVILSIVAFLALKPLASFRARAALDAGSGAIVSLLNEARNATLSSRNNTVYGVHFDPTRAIFFSGSYLWGAPGNKIVNLDASVRISDISLATNATTTIFERLTGETDQYGSITLSLVAAITTKRLISISQTGIIELNND